MDLVCFDTHVIIWGIRGKATPGQENRIEKAQYLINSCEKNGTKMMIPSVVVAEVLCALDSKSHSAVSELMHRSFIVPPFVTEAATYIANKWRIKKHVKDKAVSRAEMKADFMIAATALSRGASCIYSEDAGLRKFAQDYISVKPLPNVEKQMSIEDAI